MSTTAWRPAYAYSPAICIAAMFRKPVAVLWPKPRDPKMHADPQEAFIVLEHVHVMVASADCAQLLSRGGQQCALPRHRRLRNRVEHGMVP